jgi:chromosomal replication initiation ATPase DnaA
MINQETNNQISTVFKELDKAIDVLGTDRLIHILKTSTDNYENITQEQIDYSYQIIQATCDEFGMTIQDFFGIERKNGRRHAIGIVSYLMHSTLNLELKNISYIIKKSDKAISMYKTEISKLKESHISDRKILEKIVKIKDKLNKSKNE